MQPWKSFGCPGGVLVKRILLTAVVFALAGPGVRPADDKAAPAVEMTKEEQQLLELTNAERAKEKLPPLTPNATLFKVARRHSANMARKDEMNHVLDGKGPAERTRDAGYNYRRVAENIAEFEFGKPAEAQKPLDAAVIKEIMQLWMNSAVHRKNILDGRVEEIGLGVARNEQGKVYFTQVFGTQRKNPG
jgi:uncharacterized protein YkwD